MTEIPLNCAGEPDRAAVREQLDRILRSGPFQQSPRRQRFLEYLVTEVMAGRGERLKGYTLALEVFDRPATFDPNVDPLIRVEAARLRDTLREYYAAGGQDDPVRIDLPKGSYAPVIAFRQEASRVPLPGEAGKAQALSPDLVPAQAVSKDERPSPARGWRVADQRRQVAVPAAALLLVLLAAVGVWLARDRGTPPSGAAVEDKAPAVPKIPAIAVLPFLNLSGDAREDYFSDGLTEDILTELSRSRDLRVLARNTSFRYKGQAVDIPKLGRDLGVRYVLEGSVRRAGSRLRVTAQLIDAETGTHVWADRFDREMVDVFLVQDEIVSQIAAKVAGAYGAIESTEAKSAASKSAREIEAYDRVLRARGVMTAWDWTSDNFRSARTMLDQAFALDPSSARARRELAWFSVLGWITIPATVAASYIILGILFIGREIENPFGNDVNDLPLDSYCAQIASELDMIASKKKPRNSDWIETLDNKVLFPLSSSGWQVWMHRGEQKVRETLIAKTEVGFEDRKDMMGQADGGNEGGSLPRKSKEAKITVDSV